MSLPSLEQYRSGATTWKKSHNGIDYLLSHHGVSEYSPQGTWCFYIFLHDNLFVNQDDFKIFDREPRLVEFSGRFIETYDYDSVPDYGFHGGITWYSVEHFVDRDGTKRKSLKIGCDYAHLWDREGGFSDGLDEVEMDAKRLIEKLVEQHPIKRRCAYSGQLDIPEMFYEAQNGNWVHKTQADNLPGGWVLWRPKESP